MDAQTGCPQDYAELFTAYFPMMIGVVASSGIAAEDVEDVAMDILARFIEKDGISYYDPEMLHDVGETPEVPGARLRRAKFKSMLRGFTATYVLQYRDKQMTRHRKIIWRIDQMSDAVEHQFNNDTREFAPSEGGIIDAEVSESIVKALKQARAELIAISSGVRDYARFTALCVEHGLLDGKIDRKAIATEMDVSASTVTVMLRELRQTLQPHLVSLRSVA